MYGKALPDPAALLPTHVAEPGAWPRRWSAHTVASVPALGSLELKQRRQQPKARRDKMPSQQRLSLLVWEGCPSLGCVQMEPEESRDGLNEK